MCIVKVREEVGRDRKLTAGGGGRLGFCSIIIKINGGEKKRFQKKKVVLNEIAKCSLIQHYDKSTIKRSSFLRKRYQLSEFHFNIFLKLGPNFIVIFTTLI